MKVKGIIRMMSFMCWMSTQINAQTLDGFVLKADGAPLGKATVFFLLGDSDTSDDEGLFSLDMTSCPECTAGNTIIIYVNSDYGSAEERYTIPYSVRSNPPKIYVLPNNLLYITGTVRDKKTGRPIEGIRVTPMVVGYSKRIPSKTTDDRGIFSFKLSKSGILETDAIEVSISDLDRGKYKDDKEVLFVNQKAPLNIYMEECSSCGLVSKYRVSGRATTRLKLRRGDVVTIEASGKMSVGVFVGMSGPEGRESGVLGFSLATYNNIPEYNHAALLFRFNEYDNWKYYDGSGENKYKVESEGLLEFWINDRQLSDNSGAYDVDVKIKR